MRISHLHLDILDNTRQQIFEKLPVHTKNYYLSGGTGLALQLGHRISHDFDFFYLVVNFTVRCRYFNDIINSFSN